MKTAEIRALSDTELKNRLNDAREELMNLRFQMAMGGLTDFTRLSASRRVIARFLTIIQERESQTSQGGEA